MKNKAKKGGRRSSAVTIGKDRLSRSLSLSLLRSLFTGYTINKFYYTKKHLARYIQFMREFRTPNVRFRYIQTLLAYSGNMELRATVRI